MLTISIHNFHPFGHLCPSFPESLLVIYVQKDSFDYSHILPVLAVITIHILPVFDAKMNLCRYMKET